MKRIEDILLTAPALLTLFASLILQPPAPDTASAQSITPTPTYDPLIQPPLSSNPTELELGRYLYWRHCMPCHGDRGQGLTDEFRGIWEPDHQNCWARGCHSGRYPNDSFPLPTIVPAVVTDNGLARFETKGALFDYLKTTHPPQDPGFLKDEEYRAIASFVFEMNHRSLIDPTPAPSVTPTSSLPPSPHPTQQPELILIFGFGCLLLVILILVNRQRVKSII